MTEKNKTQEIITEASSQGLTVKQRVQIGNRRRVKRRRNFVLPLVCFAVLFALMFCIGSIESNSAASAKSPDGTPNSGLQLTFLGDIMMGRYIGQMCDDKGYDRLFSGISGIWSNSDHVFANFGSPVRTGDTSGYQNGLTVFRLSQARPPCSVCRRRASMLSDFQTTTVSTTARQGTTIPVRFSTASV